jgi:hypothetical protein
MTTDNDDHEFDSLIKIGQSPSPIPPLPSLSPTPATYPGCCLALSTTLLTNLHALLPKRPNIVLSVGSGTGLLEAVLLASPHNLNIIGVEVHPSVNRYLPYSNHREVRGTYAISDLAAAAKAWLFVYPRRWQLVGEYLDLLEEKDVQMVVWLGPAKDWEEYEFLFSGYPDLKVKWDVQVRMADALGGRPWDTLVVARKIRI